MGGRRSGTWLVAISALLVIALFAYVGPIAQDPAYHRFADQRTLLGIPNFWNVMSNVPFVFVGLTGVIYVLRNPDLAGDKVLRLAWLVFFAGIALTALGSGYYHLAPGNRPLVWDRLPMTLGFAGFFAIVIGEYISLRAASLLLLPFLLAGAASVVYWDITETRGMGDLRPYAVVQFLPILLLPAILFMHRGTSDLSSAIWMLMGFYVAAKLLEYFDAHVYGTLGIISGHSLKHVVAALAPAVLIFALHKRRTARLADG